MQSRRTGQAAGSADKVVKNSTCLQAYAVRNLQAKAAAAADGMKMNNAI